MTIESAFILNSAIDRGDGTLEIPSIVFVAATQMTKVRMRGARETFPPD